MPFSKALLSPIIISLFVVGATPVTRNTGKATLSFATKFSIDGPLNVVEKDRARAQAFKNNAGYLEKRSGSGDVSAVNSALTYTAQVGVGSPATEYTLLIDSGSSNIWVGANKTYVKTATSKDTGNAVSVSYGSGTFSGEEYLDTVTLGSSLVIKSQSIGVAISAYGFQGVDGILGVGPTDLTVGRVDNTSLVPTVTDNLLLQGAISEDVLGVYFVPASESNKNGILTFGGVDDSVITTSVRYVPLTNTSPASKYWGIDLSITYGGTTILSETAGVVDTGTTLVLIATDAFLKYQSATGGKLDHDTGLLEISTSYYVELKTLSFNVGGESYDLTPNAQIWPRSLNTAIGGNAEAIYLVVNDIGTHSGSGLDFVSGHTFLERYYGVFDASKNRVGFASTVYTESDNN